MKTKSVVLWIDTSNTNRVAVAIEFDGNRYQKADLFQESEYHKRKLVSSLSSRARAQQVLVLINKLLEEQQLRPSDLTAINVATGPGSFTGLRVGISVANMLGMLLSVPVNGLAIGSAALPQYSPSKLD